MEGSDYMDGSSSQDKKDNRIKPNDKYTYSWTVPERAGPGSDDTSCLTWAYYSDVDSVKDPNTGLVGPLIVCRKVRTLRQSIANIPWIFSGHVGGVLVLDQTLMQWHYYIEQRWYLI